MAEILVLIEDKGTTDVKSWKQYDPVDVRPDGAVYGLKEAPPKFLIIKIPGLPVETAEAYIAQVWDETDPENPVYVGLRAWKADIKGPGIPKPLQNKIDQALASDGILTVTQAQFESFMKKVL